eukprot:scaffold8124_cov99-Isochrysis_galbana.AAC.1
MIEAYPVNGDPSSEDVLDIFMELVVSRHGMPRTLRTDLGSNLSSRAAIYGLVRPIARCNVCCAYF